MGTIDTSTDVNKIYLLQQKANYTPFHICTYDLLNIDGSNLFSTSLVTNKVINHDWKKGPDCDYDTRNIFVVIVTQIYCITGV